MSWAIDFTPEAEAWLDQLDDVDFDRIAPAIDQLEERGPSLGRPTVDKIKSSRHHNMKELRSRGGHLRALFCFDPDARRSSSSAATRPATGKGGTRTTSRSPTTCTTAIWRN